jgi:hypothetical protein
MLNQADSTLKKGNLKRLFSGNNKLAKDAYINGSATFLKITFGIFRK